MPYHWAVPGWLALAVSGVPALNCQPLSFWNTYVTLSLISFV